MTSTGPPTDIIRCADAKRIAQIVHKNDYYATAIALTRDGTRFALGTHEGGVCVWDAATGRQLADEITVPLGISRRIRSLDFDQLAIGSGNCRVRLWKPDISGSLDAVSLCGWDWSDDMLAC